MKPRLYMYDFWHVSAERLLENGSLEIRGILPSGESITAIFIPTDHPKKSWLALDWEHGQINSEQELQKMLDRARRAKGPVQADTWGKR